MYGPNWQEAIRAQMFGKGGKINIDPIQSLFGDQSQHGVIPRTIQRLFSQLQYTSQNYSVYCSFLQVYNQKLYDLLQDYETKRPLPIRQDKQIGIYVQGLTEYIITNIKDCLTLLKRGESNRINRATRANIQSSRSHTIFQLLLETDNVDNRGYFKRGKLNLCDLAGSEKLVKEEYLTIYGGQNRISEQHFTELKTINLSLTTLGKVISALGKGGNVLQTNNNHINKNNNINSINNNNNNNNNNNTNSSTNNPHIPYRDSQLTRLLKDSLGGSTRTVLIATVSPNTDCSEQTVSTLKFADRAKQVMVRIKANEVSATDDALVLKLQKQVQHLREILQLKRRGDPYDVSKQMLILKQENY